MRNWGVSSLALLLLMTSHNFDRSRAKKLPPAKSRPAAASSPWVEQTLKKMTLREKLGQMLMVYYFGVFHFHRKRRIQGDAAPGRGKSRRRPDCRHDSRAAGNRAQPGLPDRRHHQRIPAPRENSAADRRGLRIRHGHAPRRRHRLPSAMAIAATGDPKLAYTAGKLTALEARACRRALDFRAGRGRQQ